MSDTVFSEAVQLLEAAHAAWSKPDIDAVLRCVSSDLEYQINAGTEDGEPLTPVGKAEFDDFWRPLVNGLKTKTRPGQLLLDKDVGRVQVYVWLKHIATGFSWSLRTSRAVTSCTDMSAIILARVQATNACHSAR